MKKICSIILLPISLISCTAVYKTVNSARKMDFDSRSDYTTYLSKKYGFDSKKIYFFYDKQKGQFLTHLNRQNVSYFYGITLNDSLKINDPYLNEQKSCFGRIDKHIKSGNIDYETVPTSIAQFDFENLNGESIDFRKGKSVIFIISTQLGKAVNKDVKELADEVTALNDPTINYYLISVDSPGEGDGI